MGTESEPGIIPRAVDEVFSYIKTVRKAKEQYGGELTVLSCFRRP
jgi:hypothetical protein